MDDWQTRSFWGQPEKHHGRAAALYVIGPYPTAEFLEKLKKILKPKKLIVAVDEGWNRRQIEDIGCLVKKGLRYAQSRNGFVHAKLYLAVWEIRGTRTACLVWGSANASLGGFDRNAEAVSRMILSDDCTFTHVLRYFENLENSEGEINSLDIPMRQGLRIQLPAFSFYSDNKRSADSFGAWIQAGFLCYPFTLDSRFGHLVFDLKKELPKTITENIFAGSGFLREKSTLRMGVPPELIIANECLHGEGAPHCQGTTPVFDTIARADSTPERSGDFARVNAASEQLARHAAPIACRSV